MAVIPRQAYPFITALRLPPALSNGGVSATPSSSTDSVRISEPEATSALPNIVTASPEIRVAGSLHSDRALVQHVAQPLDVIHIDPEYITEGALLSVSQHSISLTQELQCGAED